MRHFFSVLAILLPISALLFALLSPRIKNKTASKILTWISYIFSSVCFICVLYVVLHPFVTHADAGEKFEAICILVYCTTVVAISVLYARAHKRVILNSTSDVLSLIRSEQSKADLLSALELFLDPNPGLSSVDFLLELDISDLKHFDRDLRQGKTVQIPKMRTEAGATYMNAYLRAYAAQHSPCTDPKDTDALLQRGGWQCPCGRTNPGYTSTCTCGKNKREIPPDLRRPTPDASPTPKPTTWLCTCGRENPNYTSTCVCGKNQRDVGSHGKEQKL